MTSWDEDSLAKGSFVLYELVKLTLLITEIACPIIFLSEGLIDERKACIDHLVTFDGIDSISLSKQMHIGGLLDQKEELVFDNCMHLARTSKEWSFLNRLHYGSHRHCIVILISHYGRTLDKFARDAACSKGNLALNLR